MIEFGKQADLILYCIDSLGVTYKYQIRNHLASNISKFRYSKILKIKRVLNFNQNGLKKRSIFDRYFEPKLNSNLYNCRVFMLNKQFVLI